MANVYLLIYQHYEEFEILGCFSSLTKAINATPLERMKQDDGLLSISEYILDGPADEGMSLVFDADEKCWKTVPFFDESWVGSPILKPEYVEQCRKMKRRKWELRPDPESGDMFREVEVQ